MTAEKRVKLANIIAKLPEKEADSLYETACRRMKAMLMTKSQAVHIVIVKQSSAMAINVANRNTAVKIVEKLSSPQQIP